MYSQSWRNIETIPVRDFTCGYCSRDVASSRGYWNIDGQPPVVVLICPRCSRPTYFEADKQYPGVSPVGAVRHLPGDVAAAYEEARSCMAVNATTAAALMARKLLMSIAVSKGADENKTFSFYVDYLLKNWLSENCRSWVDAIRDVGNEGAHTPEIVDRTRAKAIMLFTQAVLRIVYEYPTEALAT